MSEATAFDQEINHYIDGVLEDEKHAYTSKLESFEAYSLKFRKKVHEQLQLFKEHFHHGYELLLATITPTLKPDETIEPFLMGEDKLSQINTLEKLTAFYADGKSLCQLFGYSPHVLATFYKAAYKITEMSRFEDGYDAYFFLVVVAPHFREAWLNFGYTACQLGNYLEGIEAFGTALDLDPTKADSYLATSGAYIKLHNYDFALQACNICIEYAKEHVDMPWASELTALLHEAKRQIESRYLV